MTSSKPSPQPKQNDAVLDVSVIGAGIAGCSAARHLLASGHQVAIFDRGRQAGGRASSNRAGFDYGLPAFTADSPIFLERVQQWQKADLVSPWQARARQWNENSNTLDDLPVIDVSEQWVANESLAGVMAAELDQVDCRQNTTIDSIDYQDGLWSLIDTDKQIVGRANQLLLAMPVEQARRLLSAPMQQAMLPVDRPTMPMSVPQWVAMLTFEEPVSASIDHISFSEHPVLAAAWSEARKPGGTGKNWIIHSTPVWAVTRLNEERQSIAEQMFAAFKQALGSCPLIMSHRAHRWTFSRARTPLALGQGPIHHQHPPLTLCGDWSLDGSFEGAWLSGRTAAEKMGNQS